MNIPLVLKKTRKRMGWSQERIAEVLNVTQSIISRWERGIVEMRTPDFMKWMKTTQGYDLMMATVLNIDLSLVADVDYPTLLDTITQLLTGAVPAMIILGGFVF